MLESESAAIEVRGLGKRFPGTVALRDVSMHVRKNEIVGLVGENGAGKSTLVKLMIGLYAPTWGEMFVHGKKIAPSSVSDAEKAGIGMVFQEQALLGNMSVAENVFLGREGQFVRGGLINRSKMNAAAEELLAELDSDLRANQRIAELSFMNRQIVEFARAFGVASIAEDNPVIILDEPTSLGTAEDVQRLFGVMRRLKERGSMIFISHRLEEILEITDRVYVMKDGAVVAEMPTAQATTDELHRLMVGRQASSGYYRVNEQRPPKETVVLSLKGCSSAGKFKDISFDLHQGEILGIVGVVGSGREDLCRALGGITRFTGGEIYLEGKRIRLRSPAEAIQHKIAYMPIDRRGESLIQNMEIAANITLPSPQLVSNRGFFSHRKERKIADDWAKRLGVKAPSTSAWVGTVSGGNQQKVVLAKWMAAGSNILVMDHPTRGIDVGAKEEVYAWIRRLGNEGRSIVLAGDTLAEVIGLSSRILVMKDGEVQGTFDASPCSKPSELDLVSSML